jgi:MFS family permease
MLKSAQDNVSVIEASASNNYSSTWFKQLSIDSGTGLYDSTFNLAVLIAGLGYFIDTFDFFLYNSMRVVSLTELGMTGDLLTKTGIIILNCQILGALIGSFIWGIMGDKLGRKKALLGSILIYSLGMIANAFIQDPLSYGITRFIIGFGVAGEIGLGATLIAESVPTSKRTYSLMLFTVLGVLGVTAAGLSIEFTSWRISCLVGGIVGLLLLTLRSFLFEPKLFIESRKSSNLNKKHGSLKELLSKYNNLKKYLLCFPLLGTNFFITGVLLTLSPEIAKATGVHEIVKANIALAIYFCAAVIGDWLGAYLSDKFKSRKLVVILFMLGNMSLAFLFLQKFHLDTNTFYILCAAFGVFNLWAITGNCY